MTEKLIAFRNFLLSTTILNNIIFFYISFKWSQSKNVHYWIIL